MRNHLRFGRPVTVAVVVLLVGAALAGPAIAVATDTDRDGLTNTFERTLSLTNPHKVDTDGDGLWDGRENPDHDGLSNRAEQNLRTKPRVADTDRDGWTDVAEYRAGFDPRSAASRPRPPKPKPTPTPTPREPGEIAIGGRKSRSVLDRQGGQMSIHQHRTRA